MFMFVVSEILLLPLAQIKRSSIRKGMVMVSPKLNPQATWEFEAEILVLHHPTTISPRYQAMGEKPSQQKISKKKKGNYIRRKRALTQLSLVTAQFTAAASGRRPPSCP